jgi:Tfp pilus assembly protein PilO
MIWFFAVKKTMNQHDQLKVAEKQMQNLEKAPLQLATMERRLEQISQAIGGSAEQLSSDEIFDKISEYVIEHKSLQIMSFPSNSSFENSNYDVHTYAIKIKGKFHLLLEMLNYFEGNKSIGKIVSVDYKVEKNLKTKKKFLIMVMYVQTYNRLS